MSSGMARVGWGPITTNCVLVAGDRVRVARGVVGRLGRVSSTGLGHVHVRYDDGGREVVDLTRRPLWLLQPAEPTIGDQMSSS
jgi:hypothetical protein